MATANSQESEHCECTTTSIAITCIEPVLNTWRPLYHVICEQCFWNDADNEMEHETLLRKIDLEERALEVIEDCEVILELFDIYSQQHKIQDCALFTDFEYKLQEWGKCNRARLLDILVEKDHSAATYFMKN
jgi:hypothetical protein